MLCVGLFGGKTAVTELVRIRGVKQLYKFAFLIVYGKVFLSDRGLLIRCMVNELSVKALEVKVSVRIIAVLSEAVNCFSAL